MTNSRKELNDLEMSMIISKRHAGLKVNYGIRLKSGQVHEGRFHMYRKPRISALLLHLFRHN